MNNSSLTPFGRRLAAGLLTAALALPLSPSFAEARTVTGNVTALSPEDIAGACTTGGSLKVNKQQPKPYQNADPSDIPAGIISGITFEAHLLGGIDITTPDGWERAAKLNIDEAQDLPVTQTFTAVTDLEGSAQFTSGMPVGVYLIREVPPQSPHENYRKTRDFLVTIPVGSAKGEYWNCDVDINTKDEPSTPPVTSTPPTETTTTETTPPSTPPSTPPATTPPVTTPPATTPPPPSKDTPRGPLPMTGANVTVAVVVALALIAAGTLLVRRRR